MFKTKIFTKGEDIIIEAKDQDKAVVLSKIISVLIKIVENNISINERDIIYISKLSEELEDKEIIDIYVDRVMITKTFNGKPIYAKTLNQKHYIKAINTNDLVFGIGPAGTGNTLLAVINTVEKIKKKLV